MRRNEKSRDHSLRILVISAHPPIESELTRNWIMSGHRVSLISKSVEWNDQFSNLDSSVERKMPKERPDVIIVGGMNDAIYALFLKFRHLWFRSKLVVIHWWFPQKFPLYFLFKNISVCKYGEKYLRDNLHISSAVVYCPVDTNFFKNSHEPGNLQKIVTIGNNFKGRRVMGYDHLIKIIELIHNRNKNLQIEIIGNNRKEDFPEYVSVKNCNKEQILQEVNKASVVFFTTTYNLVMNSMQIAMACERKVVAFDLEPFHEFIEDGISGFLIPKFDDQIFSETIMKVSQMQNDNIGIEARKSVIEKCESSSVAKKIIDYSLSNKS